jgi:hypothetical protein
MNYANVKAVKMAVIIIKVINNKNRQRQRS